MSGDAKLSREGATATRAGTVEPRRVGWGGVTILFPSQPFAPREIDADFEEEREAALAAGFGVALVDHTRVVDGEPGPAVARMPRDPGPAIYRGWMLRPADYAAMSGALEDRGVAL